MRRLEHYWTPARVDRLVRRVARRGGWVPSALRWPHQPARLPAEPSFGGPLDEEPRGRSLDPRLARLHVRAMLFANPATPCSTEEVAAVLGLRQGSVRDARPASTQRVGRALVAPFGHWLLALERAGLVPRWDDEVPDVARAEGPARRRRVTAPKLEALGGPRTVGRSR